MSAHPDAVHRPATDPAAITQTPPQPLQFFAGAGVRLAYQQQPGQGVGVVFLSGFRSDMTGVKAQAMATECARQQRPFVRFDYRGHGASEGDFLQAALSDWLDDALAVFDHLTQGPQIIVGSSMGGWLMLLLARRRPERIAGLLGLAAAPDFTEDLMWAQFGPASRQTLQRDGLVYLPSRHGDPYPITRRLLEDGRRHLLLRDAIPITCPVRLIHGVNDGEVPYATSLRLLERLHATDVQLTLVKDGEHRLSRPADQLLMQQGLRQLLAGLEGTAP